MGRLLVIAGLILVAAGVAWVLGERLGLGRLPGDFVLDWGKTRIYLPVASAILISVVLSLVLWLIGR